MQEFILKPKDYSTWSQAALTKIEKTIDSCQTEVQLKHAKNMIDNFIIIMAINDNSDDESTHQISRQLWLTYKLKENRLHAEL